MSSQRRRDTIPEIALRSALHRRGLRLRVDYRPLADSARRADIVFCRARVAVFVDGCFWHGCEVHRSLPRRNGDWWRTKIEANRRRDAATDALLASSGWMALRFWEHDGAGEAAELVAKSWGSALPGQMANTMSGLLSRRQRAGVTPPLSKIHQRRT